ncbi:thaumatin-like protein 1-like [Trifolium pratense]|uniref:Thaumatin-like protein 1-like n=1 Tax=Trifolium pratense TaxID=57577 RepID=A0A2K3MZR3_TRIPR|nr:thaumatin-like protein 1-like [Trifolium pratense]
MDLLASSYITLITLLFLTSKDVTGSTFTFVNKCDYTVWPGILANAGSPSLGSTGFELPQQTTRSFQAPAGWSGRFWARTGCNFDGSGTGSCLTGDCGSNMIECNGAGAAPPATLAEFTLGTIGQDFYDVSLVDGYNLPMIVEGSGGSGMCESTGCTSDLNQQCPAELRASDGSACKSACEAFGSPEYCCSGAYGSPDTCKPSIYSQMFKNACPRSYSYAYDDATSTFTCTAADYTVTFCPSSPSSKILIVKDSGSMHEVRGSIFIGSNHSTGDIESYTRSEKSTCSRGAKKSSQYPTTPMTSTTLPGTSTALPGTGNPVIGTGSEGGSVEYTGTDTPIGYSVPVNSGSGSGGETMLADGSYLAGLAMGDSSTTASSSFVYFSGFLLILFLL